MKPLRPLLYLFLACAALVPAQAQLPITLEIRRRLFVRYEPILATVKITNLSGRDLLLQDAEQQWFGFDVTGQNTEILVPPRNPDYKLEPLEIKIGETIKRTVNLTELYGISEYGIHRIKATIYAKELGKLFSSKPSVVEISDGKTIWKQNVGVPETMPNAGENHVYRLIEFQGDRRYLYVRVENEERGYVHCTYRIGHMIDGTTPQMQLDTTNVLHILHLVGPKTYSLTSVGPNGEFLGQHRYTAPKNRPYLRRLADGTIQIVGARRDVTATAGNAAAEAPPLKLSDRPPGLPK